MQKTSISDTMKERRYPEEGYNFLMAQNTTLEKSFDVDHDLSIHLMPSVKPENWNLIYYFI